ncbi:hypothetical protein [Photobacterium leiognathi]|uniref:hypothetical protein n=1 Tax=Photobacterium leiognathi TaxID=553611 RepID=UPI002980CFD9|nr:hypothetical protein [Photobacterium leiognathi]
MLKRGLLSVVLVNVLSLGLVTNVFAENKNQEDQQTLVDLCITKGFAPTYCKSHALDVLTYNKSTCEIAAHLHNTGKLKATENTIIKCSKNNQ